MTATHEAVARRLRDAYAGGVVPPLRDALDPTDASGAYAVQTINTRFWEAQGRRIVGRKAGLTAKAVQAQLGVDQPDFGVLFDDMRVPYFLIKRAGPSHAGSLTLPTQLCKRVAIKNAIFGRRYL